ncbi:MAG: SUMF1/EgtB/PvdO family nonheme iron enzyme, partial [Armatimonadota bacterium]|nr:SUMF1/EgtB/PvdO family nonheme iron enzyme [Armatimonadota bacterium]
FFFSGHGYIQHTAPGSEPQHFLGTVNANPTNIQMLKMSSVPLADLKEVMQSVKALSTVFILDCCRNDPEAGKGDADNKMTGDFKSVVVTTAANRQGSLVAGTGFLFACAPGERAYEWPDKQHGVFTYYLLEGLREKARGRDGEVTLARLATYVQRSVLSWSDQNGKRQTPDVQIVGRPEIVLVPGREAPTTAKLKIQSEPPGADVVVDGKVRGVTPFELELAADEQPRECQIELRRAGFKPKVIAPMLVAGRVLDLGTQVLEPEAPKSAVLAVESEPQGAEVVIEGEVKGTTPCTVELEPGPAGKRYQVELRKEGMKPYRQSVLLRPGDRIALAPPTLVPVVPPEVLPAPTPAPAPAPALATMGTLHVESNPPGAEVYVGGALQGSTPCDVVVETPGGQPVRVELELRLKGYQTRRLNPMVRPGGQTETGPVRLEPEGPVPGPSKLPAPTPTPVPTPVPAQPPGTAEIPEGMVLVPAGPFSMGSRETPPGSLSTAPEATLNLPAFLIDQCEVTNSQYAAFLNATHKESDDRGHAYFAVDEHWQLEKTGETWQVKPGAENLPVVNVSWYGAVAYAAWAGKRLPTEAEWEKAARGGGRGRRDSLKGNGNLAGAKDGFAELAPVGSFPRYRSPYGCLDMLGNVWEWTSSLAKEYPYRADDGREDPGAPGERVLRGGSYTEDDRCNLAYRVAAPPESRHENVGFRCARSVE